MADMKDPEQAKKKKTSPKKAPGKLRGRLPKQDWSLTNIQISLSRDGVLGAAKSAYSLYQSGVIPNTGVALGAAAQRLNESYQNVGGGLKGHAPTRNLEMSMGPAERQGLEVDALRFLKVFGDAMNPIDPLGGAISSEANMRLMQRFGKA